MNIFQRNYACREAVNYKDVDAFISDVLQSSAFTDTDDETAKVDLSEAEELRKLWEVVNDPFKIFLAKTGRTQAEFSRLYQIPDRTIRSWVAEDRRCPLYLRLSIAENEGLISRCSSKPKYVDPVCKRYTTCCLAFAADTAEWGGLDPYKWYTTYDGSWEETSDNANGGIDVSWAFHEKPDRIVQLAPQILVGQIIELLRCFIDNGSDLDGFNGLLNMIENL